MIDLERLQNLTLRERPFAHRLIASAFLFPNYELMLKKTDIVFEGLERFPRGRGSVIVMNHTDRYNYWPFQYRLWREKLGYTAAWVKGKYYENPWLARFMNWTNNIPLPSRGYIVSKDFQLAMGRAPAHAEYEALKRHADGLTLAAEAIASGGAGIREFLAKHTDYPADLVRRFDAMMERVIELSRDGLRRGIHIVIFPQGTRSVRLTQGHTGAAQFVLATGADVVPVGCNGSDLAYPGSSPWSSGGRITYRIGETLTQAGALSRFKVAKPFIPFTRDAETQHAAVFRSLTDLMMERINSLLDPRHQFADGGTSTKGADRFL